MKKYFSLVIILIICLAFINGEKQYDPVFDQLFSLEGKWIMKTKKGTIEEEWRKISNDYLQSRGYMTRGNDTIATERVALRNSTEGIYYTSTVEGQNNHQPIAFKLASAVNNVFVFENPQHDFPKRITYHFVNPDSLCAWIDDGKEAPEKKSTFRYSRQR